MAEGSEVSVSWFVRNEGPSSKLHSKATIARRPQRSPRPNYNIVDRCNRLFGPLDAPTDAHVTDQDSDQDPQDDDHHSSRRRSTTSSHLPSPPPEPYWDSKRLRWSPSPSPSPSNPPTRLQFEQGRAPSRPRTDLPARLTPFDFCAASRRLSWVKPAKHKAAKPVSSSSSSGRNSKSGDHQRVATDSGPFEWPAQEEEEDIKPNLLGKRSRVREDIDCFAEVLLDRHARQPTAREVRQYEERGLLEARLQ